ncbi:hypothetical protein [Cyclobacterium xiamenense]|uniref:hypothetical protein n=1 Tax=Cyclobacterium xiamenense TaxID=1297121 RepID=UPI0012B7BC95|nr:hypothetical protein [Cyclobacterium xiamenense]
MNKYLPLLIALLGGFWDAFAQTPSDIGKIYLSIVMPETDEGLDPSQLSRLEAKIAQLVTNTGLAGSGYTSNFVIYPKFVVYETNTVEGGMANVTIVSCELGLFIKQVDGNILFSTISKPLRGSGRNKTAAITHALSKIPSADEELDEFIETGKKRIIAYYELICADLINRSESLVAMQDYTQALGLLMSVPNEVSCYQTIQQKSIEAYQAFQNQKCVEQLQEAKTYLASNQYQHALRTLRRVDPSTPCFEEAENLVNRAADEVDAEENKLWDQRMRVYEDQIALTKERIHAIKEIAASYYRSKPTSVNYTYLLR